MANNASATVDLKILISVIQNQSASLSAFQTQIQGMLKQLQTNMPAGVIPGLAANVGKLNQQITGIQAATNAGVAGIKSLDSAIGSLTRGMRFLAGGFLAFESIRFLKGIADVAARAETLQTVLHVVANNAGVSSETIDKLDKKVQALGITAKSSRESLTKMMSAGLSTEFAPALARAAQDLAVISGMDSSQTFSRLITNIQQLDTMGLRWMGIIADRKLAEQHYRDLHKEITGELTKRQMQEALLLEVLEKAKLMQGAYTNAMGDVGKQLTSLDRYTENYKKTLGDALLPAYSAIVREITSLLQQMTLQAQVFAANKERSLAWAESIQTVVHAIGQMILFVHDHLDQIVELIKWYALLKTAMAVWSILNTAVTYIVGLINFIQKLRVVMAAWNAGTIGMTLAIQAMSTANATAAVTLMEVATAEQVVTAESIAAAAAVRTLTLAWGLLVAALAIPAIGYLIIKAMNENAEEDAMSFGEKAAKARADMLAGRANRRDTNTGFGAEGGYTEPGYFAYLEDWKRANPDIASKLKTQKEAIEAFDQYLMGRPEAIKGYADEIGKANSEIRAGQLALAESKSPAERLYAEDTIKAGTKKLEDAKKAMNAAFEQQMAPSSKVLSAQMQLVTTLEAQVSAADKNKTTGQKVIDNLRDQLTVEKEQLAVQQQKFEENLAAEGITDPERIKRQQDLVRVKGYFAGQLQATEPQIAAFQTLFGDARFDKEGMTSGGFNKMFGAFEETVAKAKTEKAQLGAVLETTAEELRRGMLKVGQAAQTDVDLSKVTKVVGGLGELGVSGLDAKGRQAVELARLNTEQATLAEGAPILNRRLENISRAAEKEIEEMRASAARRQADNQMANLDLETRYKQHLVLLDTYFDERAVRIREEGNRELAILDRTIKKYDEQAKAAGSDPRRAADLRQQAQAARNQRAQAEAKVEFDIAQLRAEQEAKRTDMIKNATTALLAQQAAAGGLVAALENINRQMDLEREKTAELPMAQANLVLLLKRQQLEAAAYQKVREETLNLEKGMTKALQDEVALQQAQRDVAEARDNRLLAQGQITTRQAMQRQQGRTEEAMIDNRFTRIKALQDIQNTRDRQANELLREKGRLQELVNAGALTPEEAQRKQTDFDQRQTAELKAQLIAVEGLDKAYEELTASSEKYGQAIKKHFMSGFADALTTSILDFKKAGEAWVNLSKSIANDIVSVFTKAFTERLFEKMGLFDLVDATMDKIFGKRASASTIVSVIGGFTFAGGGPVEGPGTGTSDSIPAMLSAGEHVMPAAKAAVWMPVLEAIRTGRLGMSMGGPVQSISMGSIIPRRYAGGGVVMTDGGASAVTTGAMNGNMMVQLHPEALNMTMRDWLEHEVVRQHSRR